MIKKIINCWIRHKTKNLTRIPLFTMTFDYRKYKADGKKDRGFMKHQKEWHTCDRCGKEIIHYDEKYAYIKTREIKPLHEKSICTAEVLAKEVFPMAIWRDDIQYDLCPKCRRDFKRFMRNDS